MLTLWLKKRLTRLGNGMQHKKYTLFFLLTVEDLDVWLGVGITFIVLSGLASIFTLALTVTTGLGCHWYW